MFLHATPRTAPGPRHRRGAPHERRFFVLQVIVDHCSAHRRGWRTPGRGQSGWRRRDRAFAPAHAGLPQFPEFPVRRCRGVGIGDNRAARATSFVEQAAIALASEIAARATARHHSKPAAYKWRDWVPGCGACRNDHLRRTGPQIFLQRSDHRRAASIALRTAAGARARGRPLPETLPSRRFHPGPINSSEHAPCARVYADGGQRTGTRPIIVV